MRIGYRKKVGSFYVSNSVNTKGAGKGCLSILLLPFYLMYYVCIWPFIAIYRLVSRKAKKEAKIVRAEAAAMAPQYLRIINDCSRLVADTKSPEVFFDRYDLLLETLSKLAEIENVAPLKGARPSDELQRFLAIREEATGDFIERYARDTRTKIYELSTPKGKANKAEAFKNIMFEYADKMTEDNKRHVMLAYEDMKNNAVNS